MTYWIERDCLDFQNEKHLFADIKSIEIRGVDVHGIPVKSNFNLLYGIDQPLLSGSVTTKSEDSINSLPNIPSQQPRGISDPLRKPPPRGEGSDSNTAPLPETSNAAQKNAAPPGVSISGNPVVQPDLNKPSFLLHRVTLHIWKLDKTLTPLKTVVQIK